jgi:hypothetical protein
MFLIPSWLVSLVTFPGVIVHEFAHKKFCDWTGVPVRKVAYFRFGNPAGYVEHDEPAHLYQMFLISVGPLIVNSALAVLLAYLSIRLNTAFAGRTILIWIAFAAGACAFPSDADAKNVLDKGGALLYPFFALIRLANKLRYFYFDFIYAALLLLIGFAIK